MALQTSVKLRGRYEILRAVKSGGMGAVYEARDHNLAGSPCAIKEVLDNSDPYVCASFEKEMKALVELDHPNIPKVRDFFTDGDKRYIVMEFLCGQSLDEEIQDHREATGRGLPPGKAVADILAVLEIAEYLHHRVPALVHRDIKPANIIRDGKTGRIKLVDFGLARSVDNSRSMQTMVGTIGYCAPEQLFGLAEPCSDLFSIGCTLYHMLTGQPPELDFKPLDLNMPSLRPGLDRIIARSTEPRAADRYRSAEEMAAELRVWQSGVSLLYPTFDRPQSEVSPATVSVPEGGRHRAWALVAGLSLCLGLTGGLIFSRPTPKALPESNTHAIGASPNPLLATPAARLPSPSPTAALRATAPSRSPQPSRRTQTPSVDRMPSGVPLAKGRSAPPKPELASRPTPTPSVDPGMPSYPTRPVSSIGGKSEFTGPGSAGPQGPAGHYSAPPPADATSAPPPAPPGAGSTLPPNPQGSSVERGNHPGPPGHPPGAGEGGSQFPAKTGLTPGSAPPGYNDSGSWNSQGPYPSSGRPGAGPDPGMGPGPGGKFPGGMPPVRR